jgi:hypothetical protein
VRVLTAGGLCDDDDAAAGGDALGRGAGREGRDA